MRLQLQGLRRRAVCQIREAAEPLRAGRQRHRPHAQAALSGARRRAGDAAGANGAGASQAAPVSPLGRSRDNPVYATFLSRRRLNKPGSEKETWHIDIDLAGTDLDYVVGDSFGIFPANDPGSGRRGARRDRGAAGFSHRRTHAARGAHRRRLAVAGARHAVPADLLSHRRRAPAEGEAARRRRGSGRRCGDARRARGPAQIPRRQARSGSLHRGARSAAAAALFDLVVAQVKSGPRFAHRRCGALRGRQAHAARRLLDLPRRSHRAWRQDQGLCAEGAAFRAAGRPGKADHHDRTGHRHRAVPRLPARAAGHRRVRAATGCSSAISAATTISSTKTSSSPCARPGC